ncbi:MAG: endolytic transglycosylase MltG [Sphingomonadaceae bacterium]
MAARRAGLPLWAKLAAGAFALFAIVSVAAFLWVQAQWQGEPAPDGAVVEVEIPRGASLTAAAQALANAGLVGEPRAFVLAARLLGGSQPIHYGLYGFIPGEGWGVMLDRMQRGDVVTIRITIPEGLPSILVAERLMAQPRLVGEVDIPPEGSVLPATYEAHPGDERAVVLDQMQTEMTRVLDTLWAQRKPHSVVKSKKDAIILASIVEKETAVPEERRRIAGLYSNRLERGMRLEADPTVIYPITKGKPLGRRIRRSELAADHGYNSYLKAGLPIGPIANPGRASIEAVLDPEQHDYVFMVADGSGGHAFARTFSEHRANVAKWYAIRRERGEM